MAYKLRVLVLGCSAVTTGELTMGFELLKRCRRPMELHALVGTSLVGLASWYGARVHPYPTIGVGLALGKIESVVRAVRPDVIFVADMLLMYGLSMEFAGRLSGLVPEALAIGKVVGLDLYDFDRTALDVDIFGRHMLETMPYIPAELGRVSPSPSLRPEKSTPGRGRYAMMDDHGPLADADKRATRAGLGITGDEAMVVITTSAWQHRLAQRAESAAVATHFPTLLYEYLDQAAQASRPVHVIHVGGDDMPPPAAATRTKYQHHTSMPPEAFKRLLGAADLYLSPNCPASTAVRAMSLRVPVATLFAGSSAPDTGSSPATQALGRYIEATRGGYPFFLWPVGLHAMLARVLEDNPFAGAQKLLDIHEADRAVEGIATLLRGGAAADALRHAEESYFREMLATVDSPDDALASALFER